ncbi:MAG: biotin/lipoyl-binding protein, partial [Gammaproteobacteria bacterium]|nr:biotin/lipoyl-binding protein [Gammaproteobacteria bacterium]
MKILRVFAAALLAVAVVAAWTPARERVAGWLDRDRAGDDELVLYGNVDVRELELAFRQAGRMLAVQVDEGDRVAAGELVATLDDEPFRQRVAAAAAEVDRARAELDALEHGSRPQEIARAAAEVRRVRAVLTNAERELARRRSLLAGHAASQTATDAAQAARDEAAAALVAAQE